MVIAAKNDEHVITDLNFPILKTDKSGFVNFLLGASLQFAASALFGCVEFEYIFQYCAGSSSILYF
jgi:hypothetical protein